MISAAAPPVATLARCAAAGVLAGLASLFPGVSAGTMILAAGVYPQLVGAIAEILSGKFRTAPLARLGMTAGFALIAVFAVAGAARDAVTAWPLGFLALFLGLTLGGAPLLWRMAESRRPAFVLGAVLGGLAVMLTVFAANPIPPETAESPVGWPALAAAGVISAFAMVLPGISGSTLLLSMGMYLPFLNAVDRVTDALTLRPWDPQAIGAALVALAPFLIGAAIGIAAASRLMRYFLAERRQATLGALFGLLLGASAALWPFQSLAGVLFLPTAGQAAVAAAAVGAGFAFTFFLGSGSRTGGR